MPGLDRAQILPESELPNADELLAEGQRLARTVTVGPCSFLTAYGVRSIDTKPFFGQAANLSYTTTCAIMGSDGTSEITTMWRRICLDCKE
jgi:hypothetical protein